VNLRGTIWSALTGNTGYGATKGAHRTIVSHHAIFLTIGIYAVVAGITTVIASMNGHAEVAVMAGWVAKLFTMLFLLYLVATLLSAWWRQASRRAPSPDE
jgi:uncharacterized membrane protein YtjA (UPF0391 family)